jgi:hypothetical protein
MATIASGSSTGTPMARQSSTTPSSTWSSSRAAEELRRRFQDQVPGVELRVVESPYRELVQPLIRYLEMLAARDDETVTIVLVPERIVRHWWERLLYNQNAHRIRDALTGHPGILVADVPFRRS